jgi:hypothetical protein
MGTSSGLAFDMTAIADNQEWGANIDSIVSKCGFIALKYAIVGKGRNLRITDNVFTGGAIAIKGYFYLYGANVKSAFRGWEVIDNRFHVVGAARVYLHDTVTPSVCIQFPTAEEFIPTGGPAFSDNLIHDNHSDWSVGLYEGALHSISIKNNLCVRSSGPLVVCDASAAERPSNSYAVAAIANNIFYGRADAGSTEYYYTSIYGIYLKNVCGVHITGNSFNSSGLEMIKIEGFSYWNMIHDNTIIYANNCYTRLGDAAAINVAAVATMKISSNSIMGGASWGGIHIADGEQFVVCADNYIETLTRGGELISSAGGTSQWAYPAYHHFQVSNDEDEHGAWILHPYGYYDGTRYRRIILDGFVETVRGLKVMPTFPASASAPGQRGEIRLSGDTGNTYLYFCKDDNTWVRVALATW